MTANNFWTEAMCIHLHTQGQFVKRLVSNGTGWCVVITCSSSCVFPLCNYHPQFKSTLSRSLLLLLHGPVPQQPQQSMSGYHMEQWPGVILQFSQILLNHYDHMPYLRRVTKGHVCTEAQNASDPSTFSSYLWFTNKIKHWCSSMDIQEQYLSFSKIYS